MTVRYNNINTLIKKLKKDEKNLEKYTIIVVKFIIGRLNLLFRE